MTVPPRLSVVTVGARDVVAQRAFYERLGWTTTTPEGDFAAFPLGGAVFTLYDMRTLAAEAGGFDVPEPAAFNGVTLAINVETPDMVDAALDQAVAAGGTILKPGTQLPFGYGGYFADPDGHPWEICHNGDFPLGPDGRITID